MVRQDTRWQDAATVRWYLDSVRGAIPFAAEHVAVMLQMLANSRLPVRRFLDLGAGDGFLSAVLLAHYPAAEAMLVDFSPPMLEAAKARLASLTSQPTMIAADLATPAWREAVAAYAPFDAIVSSFAIHHLPKTSANAPSTASCSSCSTPGGTFAHIEHVAPEAPWIARAFDEAMIDAIWEYGRRSEQAMTRADAATGLCDAGLDQDANLSRSPGHPVRLATRGGLRRREWRHSAGTRSPSSAAIAPPDITPTCYTSSRNAARADGARAVSCATTGEALHDTCPYDSTRLTTHDSTRKDLPW